MPTAAEGQYSDEVVSAKHIHTNQGMEVAGHTVSQAGENTMPEHDRYDPPNRRITDVAMTGIVVTMAVSSLITMVTAVMMALGAGLGSTPESRVPYVANVLWAIGGFNFVPCGILVIATVITRKQMMGFLLGIGVLLSGLGVAAGWLINAGGELPGNSSGNVMFTLVSVIPVLAGGLIIWLSHRSVK